MPFDTKQLRTFKWLQAIASKPPRGCKRGVMPAIYEGNVLVRYGRFYATNGYIIACVEWPEYQHAGDECWMVVDRFTDISGRLLQSVEMSPLEAYQTMKDDALHKYFPYPNDRGDGYNRHLMPSVIMQGLKGFDINNLQPGMQFTDTTVTFTAHNSDISMQVLCMLCM